MAGYILPALCPGQTSPPPMMGGDLYFLCNLHFAQVGTWKM